MTKKINTILPLLLPILIILLLSCRKTTQQLNDEKFVNYIVNLKTQNLKFYWKINDSTNYYNFNTLKKELEINNKELLFAVNGGMYNPDHSPQGLYIENGETLAEIDRQEEGYGNFYLQPNGVFYITKNNKSVVCTTKNFKNNDAINFATQSGPMLVINSAIHPVFKKGSKHLNIRNGVGVLPDGNLLFAMSKEELSLYDFASYFKKNGCENALYLDGFVSRTYLPSKNWIQEDGNFGVIIAVTKSNN